MEGDIMNNTNNDLVNKTIAKIEEEIIRMDPRDLITMQNCLMDFSYYPPKDDFIGTTGRNYGKFNISRDELLKIVNKHLIGKETADWLETVTKSISNDFQNNDQSNRKMR